MDGTPKLQMEKDAPVLIELYVQNQFSFISYQQFVRFYSISSYNKVTIWKISGRSDEGGNTLGTRITSPRNIKLRLVEEGCESRRMCVTDFQI